MRAIASVFAAVFSVARATGEPAPTICGAPVQGSAAAFAVVERRGPADTLATITVCLVADTTRWRIAGYHGQVVFGPSSRVVRVDRPPGATRIENTAVRVLTPTGTGSGVLRFQRNATQLAPGTYYDTLNITSNAASSVHQYFDTLVVTPGTALHLGLSAVAHVDSNFAGIGQADSTLVRIAGPGGSTAPWTATRKRNFGFIVGGTQNVTAVSGTGNGVVSWSMVSVRTTPTGWLVDTITVKLTANPTDSAVFFDSLLVVPPVQYALSTTGRRDSIAAGGLNKLDSVAVSFSGLWGTRASWKLNNNNRPLEFLVPVAHGPFAFTYSATGNATAYFQRPRP